MMLRPSTLFWKLFLGTTLLIVLVLCACTWLILLKMGEFHEDELTAHLRVQAITVRQAVRDKFDRGHASELDRLAKDLTPGGADSPRVTLILRDGTVVADSEADPREMESHADRKEVQQALAEGWGEDTHYSRTVGREMKYVAVRVGDAESAAGVVRVSMGLRTIARRRGAIRELTWTITLIGLTAAILFAMGLALVWSNPIRRITVIARSLSRGDLSARARITGNDEMALLGRSLNEMREHLSKHLETIDGQRRTLESLLTQLHEGVVVAGPDRRILLINPAAVRFLRPSPAGTGPSRTLVGSAVEQCVSQRELQRMLLRSSSANAGTEQADTMAAPPGVQEAHIKVDSEQGELSLLARASDIALPGVEQESEPLALPDRRLIGRLLVLTDITELDRTAQVKMDFASNASHELRTPLAAIRAAVETLMDMGLTANAESARRFLEVIDRQGGRMEQMVSDLLDLSKIESSRTQFKPQTLNLPQLLEDLHARYRDHLETGQLQWTVDVPAELSSITANPYLLRTILDNLVDNAIRFTDQGGRISVLCRQGRDDETNASVLSITVADTGCGIAEEEQGRVFERFYQVERARSRGDGGTGLGLSIVRHAVSAMNGTVRLDSRLGEGTSVTITLPQPG